MSRKICLSSSCLYYPSGGGHLWVFLNWSLSLKRLGFDVYWLEYVDPYKQLNEFPKLAKQLKSYLKDYEFSFHWMSDYAKKAIVINSFIDELNIKILVMLSYKHSFIE